MQSSGLSSIKLALFLGLPHLGTEVTEITGATTIDSPRDQNLTFTNSATNQSLKNWQEISGVIIGPAEVVIGEQIALLVSENPRRDFGRAVTEFFVTKSVPTISSTAQIDPTATIGTGVSIGHNVVIENDVVIGDHSVIGHNTTILARTRIGNHCVIGSNSVLGSIGFGLERDESGEWVRLPHIGNLFVEDHVEIGSSTVIARGTIIETRICRNCKIDDNVFIAHNVLLGENSVVIANAEISGSVIVGENCWIGPSSTIIQGMQIGSNSLVGIGSVVIKDVGDNEVVAGNPARLLRKQDPT